MIAEAQRVPGTHCRRHLRNLGRLSLSPCQKTQVTGTRAWEGYSVGHVFLIVEIYLPVSQRVKNRNYPRHDLFHTKMFHSSVCFATVRITRLLMSLMLSNVVSWLRESGSDVEGQCLPIQWARERDVGR